MVISSVLLMSSRKGLGQRTRHLCELCGSVVAIFGVIVVVALAQKPYPIYTTDHLVATMETLGPNFIATMQSLDAADYATTKERLSRSREQLATTVTFWRDYERDDAVGYVRAALQGMDDLDAALSMELVDSMAVEAVAAEIRAACASCHAVYREQDPTTGDYRLKSGVLE